METCCSCQKPKATLQCGLCKSAVCKNCAQFLPEGSFSFLKEIPEDLKHGTYCGPCYDSKVAPELSDYEETMERAKNIAVFFKNQSKETRLMRRAERPFKITDCADRDEALMRLAFLAAKGKYNALIDVDITSEKILSGRYQTSKWSGTGVPTTLDERRINRP